MPFSLHQRSEREGFYWMATGLALFLTRLSNAGSTGSLEADLVPVVLLAQPADKRVSLKGGTWEK